MIGNSSKLAYTHIYNGLYQIFTLLFFMKSIVNSIGLLFLIISCHSCNIEGVLTLNKESTDYVWAEEAINDTLSIQDYLFGGKYSEVARSISLYDKINKECTYFYRNGNVMSYKFYSDGKLRYYRNYDLDGVTESYNGGGILYVDSIVYDTIFTNNRYKVDVYLVRPPNTEVRVFIGDYVENELKRDMKKHPLYPYPIANSKTSYQIENINKGIRKVVIYWSIEDIVSKDIQKGRMIHQYTVLPSTQP